MHIILGLVITVINWNILTLALILYRFLLESKNKYEITFIVVYKVMLTFKTSLYIEKHMTRCLKKYIKARSISILTQSRRKHSSSLYS